ncbi:hypothetical protein LG58_1493 [Kosakonia radicincitans YD4]|nr:hypothetical protein LG58_1493 [Kosakonia radicincitans YD4]
MKNAPLNLPAGYFGIVLGIIGLGFSWRFAATFWPVTLCVCRSSKRFPCCYRENCWFAAKRPGVSRLCR